MSASLILLLMVAKILEFDYLLSAHSLRLCLPGSTQMALLLFMSVLELTVLTIVPSCFTKKHIAGTLFASQFHVFFVGFPFLVAFQSAFPHPPPPPPPPPPTSMVFIQTRQCAFRMSFVFCTQEYSVYHPGLKRHFPIAAFLLAKSDHNGERLT